MTRMIFNLRREYFIYMKSQGEDGKNKPTQDIAKQKKDREDGHERRLDGKGMGTEDNEY